MVEMEEDNMKVVWQEGLSLRIAKEQLLERKRVRLKEDDDDGIEEAQVADEESLREPSSGQGTGLKPSSGQGNVDHAAKEVAKVEKVDSNLGDLVQVPGLPPDPGKRKTE